MNVEHIVSWNDEIISIDAVQLGLDELELLFCHLFRSHGRLQLLEGPLTLCLELFSLGLGLLQVVSFFRVVDAVPLGVQLIAHGLGLHEKILAGLALPSHHFLRALLRYGVGRWFKLRRALR